MTNTDLGQGGDHDRSTTLPAPAPVPVAPAGASYLGALCAIGLIALGVVGIRDGIVAAGWIDGRLWTRMAVDWIDGQTFQSWMVPVGIITALLGVLCVVLALKPRRKRAVALSARSSVYLELSDAARVAAIAARSVPGVVDANARARRRQITVRARTTGADPAEQRTAVSSAVTDALAPLAKPPRVKVRVNTGGRR
ncbi:DUF6286 domain-containing protein [Mycobacterium sp. IDR2000157661]|uniref:DUF6286 domain-containing protein n=1 Tax=Mycobacterium sp. IDR2000157661 TaxID=2867005 RepID=UPI001EEA1A12|nr:DUF6286 domain-containing protein [Mycobacterium sp. IDR2000157661]ULE31868.1 hypothetical protein K3G64_16980 [Mycobacterium sp. IDR2000157661]